MHLADFQSIRPSFESSQEETLNWLIEAHVKAEGNESFRPALQEKLLRVGCKPKHIEKRGHVLSDFSHLDWERMEIYRLDESPYGKGLSERSRVFQLEVEKIFERYFPPEALPPDDLIHVSCTGYVSPSGAQKIVSKRNWGKATTVTHAYHMGCYGSIPALRIGGAFLNEKKEKKRVDIVHTEICSLHSNPSKHELDQLVCQTLFADGFIKYSLLQNPNGAHIKVRALKEEIIPESADAMRWDVMDWGFQMFLGKEVPGRVCGSLESYLSDLCKGAVSNSTLFAIHPGGPKILMHIQKLLRLTDRQIQFSFEVLKEYGNMSSATLPHIWKKILEDESIPSGTLIVSLAFGPGLTIGGALMEKICGS